MNGKPYTKDGATDPNENSLPIGESAPTALPVEPAKPDIPETVTKKYVSTYPSGDGGQQDVEKYREPFLVSVIKDGTPTPFEQVTLRYGKWGLVIAGVSLFAACVAAIFVFQQFKEMAAQTELLNRAAHQSRKDSQDSSIATGKQLAVLQGQLNQQQHTMLLDERAWLGAVKIGVVNAPIGLNNPVIGLIELTNSGKSPAKKVRTLAAIQALKKGVVLVPKYAIDKTDQPSYSVIQPGMPMEITTLPIEGTQGKIGTVGIDDLADFKSGDYIVYIYGIITYEDIFSHKHTTKFCGFVNRNLQTVRACQSYNEAN
jgi:hypothetical protein